MTVSKRVETLLKGHFQLFVLFFLLQLSLSLPNLNLVLFSKTLSLLFPALLIRSESARHFRPKHFLHQPKRILLSILFLLLHSLLDLKEAISLLVELPVLLDDPLLELLLGLVPLVVVLLQDAQVVLESETLRPLGSGRPRPLRSNTGGCRWTPDPRTLLGLPGGCPGRRVYARPSARPFVPGSS